jgi:hypothetical protein
VEGSPENSGFHTGSSGKRVYFNYHRLNDLKEQMCSLGFNEIEVLNIPYESSDSMLDMHTVIIGVK